jgi:HEAT repeat protein
VQLEPVYGGKADTAAEVRIQCGIALVRIGHPDALFELANHLADREVEVRRAAVKAVAAVGSESGGLLLRLKALTGDEDADVLAFAFSGLMAIAPERSLGFAASYLLSAGPEVAQGAALAIGGSATPEAFAALRRAWDQCLDAERKTMLLLPIALTRQDGAKEFLLGVVREEHQAKAEEAVAALKLFEADASLCGLLRDAVDERGDPVVEKAFLDEFGPLA